MNNLPYPLIKISGFVEEGCERQAYWTEGAWRDCVNMGILADEWRALQEKPTKNDAAAG